jgi:hypothetical protein
MQTRSALGGDHPCTCSSTCTACSVHPSCTIQYETGKDSPIAGRLESDFTI